jgi:hypothetical protein
MFVDMSAVRGRPQMADVWSNLANDPKWNYPARGRALCWDVLPRPANKMRSNLISHYIARGRRLWSGLLLRDDSFQPCNVFQEALTGQDEEVIVELRILKVDFKQPFIS